MCRAIFAGCVMYLRDIDMWAEGGFQMLYLNVFCKVLFSWGWRRIELKDYQEETENERIDSVISPFILHLFYV